MKKKKLFTSLLALVCLTAFGQGAKNIKINEVLTRNTTSIVDEYDHHLPWVELANVSFTTYNVRGMYITTDTATLNKSLSVPDRVARMSIIPSNDPRTSLSGRQHLILFLNSSPAQGSRHLTASVDASQPLWIGLFDGNGVDLVDSVTIPVALHENTSYARAKDGADEWEVKTPDAVTAGIENYIHVTESKVAQIKRDDPHGFGITLLSMGIVFACLALLCVFFSIFGRIMSRKQQEKHASDKQAHRNRMMANDNDEDERAFPNVVERRADGEAEDNEVYIAVISMALKEYFDNTHDHESGIITIIPKETKWTRV